MNNIHRQWIEDFLKNCEQSNKSVYTIKNYRCDLERYIDWFENEYKGNLNFANAQVISLYKEDLSRIQEKLLQGYQPKEGFWTRVSKVLFDPLKKRSKQQNLLDMNQKGLAVSSRRRHLSCIKNFYDYLKQSNEDHNKLFKNNPVKPKLHGIKLKESDVENTKFLGPKDWECLITSTINLQARLIINILYWGGLRLSELQQLKFSDFNSENKTIKIIRKGGYLHNLPIQNFEEIYFLLNDFKSMRSIDNDRLFLNKKNRPLSTRSLYGQIMKLYKKSLCPTVGLTPHSFRKACATNLYNRTKDLLLVRDYLHHADAKVTQTYIEKNQREI